MGDAKRNNSLDPKAKLARHEARARYYRAKLQALNGMRNWRYRFFQGGIAFHEKEINKLEWKARRQRADELLAYHEAGHCVVFAALHHEVPKAVTIRPDHKAGYGGRTWLPYNPIWPSRRCPDPRFLNVSPEDLLALRRAGYESEVQGYLAGFASEARFAPDDKPWARIYQHSRALSTQLQRRLKEEEKDFLEAKDVLELLFPVEEEKMQEFDRLWEKTQALVRQPLVWADITFLATTLLQTPTLEGDALDEVFERLPSQAQ